MPVLQLPVEVPGQLALEWPPPSPAGPPPEAWLAVRRLVTMFVEVINGFRPAAHLRDLCAPGNATAIVAHSVTAAYRVATTGGAPRPRDRHGRPGRKAAVLKLRQPYLPLPHVMEVTVLLLAGGRTWALAFRMEHRRCAWLTTALQLI